MNKRRSLFLFAIVACQILLAPAKVPPSKQLAGPPSEFKDHSLPSPTVGALTEQSAFLEVRFQTTPHGKQDSVVWKTDLPVDSSKAFGFSIFSPEKQHIKLTLKDPQGKVVPKLEQYAHDGEFPIGLNMIPETTYLFTADNWEGELKGVWHLELSMSSLEAHKVEELVDNDEIPNGAVLLWNLSPVQIYGRLNTYDLKNGKQLGLLATITNQPRASKHVDATPLKDVIIKAEMDVYLPDGHEEFVEMHDDGLHGDLEANDGVYGAFIPATEVGIYRASAVLQGTTPDGTAFIRSSQHLIPVVEDKIEFMGKAVGDLSDQTHLKITLPVQLKGTMEDIAPMYQVYSEVWGKDSNNNDIPVCWLSTMAPVKPTGLGSYKVELTLDLKWVSLAKAVEPFTLKNLLIQDPYVYVPLDEVSQIPIESSVSINKVMRALNMEVTEITREMRVGVPPPNFFEKKNSTAAEKNGIVLLHGYCSGDNPWKSNDWTNPYYFLDKDSSVPHQTFAELVHDYAEDNSVQVYATVGHSQGGAAALHLLNFFWSGMEKAKNGRLIQSVGTPYMGCSAAGTAADLGKAFGIGCGENFDLTMDGAELWIRGITEEHRKEVYYYTTTYEQGKFFGDYCNLAMNFVLKWPNDGTSELDLAQLPGANNMGNKEKWCHTTGMGYPAQYTDNARNKEMNAKAAR